MSGVQKTKLSLAATLNKTGTITIKHDKDPFINHPEFTETQDVRSSNSTGMSSCLKFVLPELLMTFSGSILLLI